MVSMSEGGPRKLALHLQPRVRRSGDQRHCQRPPEVQTCDRPRLAAVAHPPAASGWLMCPQSRLFALPAWLQAVLQQLASCSAALCVLLLRPAIDHATQAGEELLACGGTAMQMALVQ